MLGIAFYAIIFSVLGFCRGSGLLGQILKYLIVDKTIILDKKTSSQQEDPLVCLVLCLVVAIFLERTKRIGTDSEY